MAHKFIWDGKEVGKNTCKSATADTLFVSYLMNISAEYQSTAWSVYCILYDYDPMIYGYGLWLRSMINDMTLTWLKFWTDLIYDLTMIYDTLYFF